MAITAKKKSATVSRKTASKASVKKLPAKVSKKVVKKVKVKEEVKIKPAVEVVEVVKRSPRVARKGRKRILAKVIDKDHKIAQAKKEAYSIAVTHQQNRNWADPKNLIVNSDLSFSSLIDGAAIICSKRFFSFLEINLYLTLSFLLTTFVLLWEFGEALHNSFAGIIGSFAIFNILGVKSSTYFVVFLLFWIFFCWLRSSYLVAINNYFSPENHQEKPLQKGFRRIISFMLAEFLQVLVGILGLVMGLVMMPVFMVQYFLSLPAMIAQKERAINSLFESKEYVKGQFFKTLNCSLSITLFIGAAMASCLLITDAFFKDKMMLFAVNFFLFSFLFLPLHASYRFLLYKKLQNITGEMRFKSTLKERVWFVFSRITLLAVIIIDVFLFAVT